MIDYVQPGERLKASTVNSIIDNLPQAGFNANNGLQFNSVGGDTLFWNGPNLTLKSLTSDADTAIAPPTSCCFDIVISQRDTESGDGDNSDGTLTPGTTPIESPGSSSGGADDASTTKIFSVVRNYFYYDDQEVKLPDWTSSKNVNDITQVFLQHTEPEEDEEADTDLSSQWKITDEVESGERIKQWKLYDLDNGTVKCDWRTTHIELYGKTLSGSCEMTAYYDSGDKIATWKNGADTVDIFAPQGSGGGDISVDFKGTDGSVTQKDKSFEFKSDSYSNVKITCNGNQITVGVYYV